MRLILSFLFCLIPAWAFAQQADDDRGLLESFIEDNLSTGDSAVDIVGFRGALSSRATLERLTIADRDGIWLTLADVELVWSRAALLSGRLDVDTLSARQITLTRLPKSKVDPAQSEASPFALPDLPVSVEIGTISAENVTLGQSVLGVAAEFSVAGALSLSDGNGAASFDIKRLDDVGQFTLEAAFSNASRVLNIDLALSEGPEGLVSQLLSLPGAPSLEMTVKGDGPLSNFTADLRIATDGTERIAGQVVLSAAEDGAHLFSTQVSGDMAALVAPDLQPFFGPGITFSARGRQSAEIGLELEQLSLRAAAIELEGSLLVGADGLPRRFDLQGAISDDGDPVVLPVSGPRISLTRAEIDARFDASSGNQWRATIGVDNLKHPDFEVKQGLFSGDGRIETLGDPAVDAALALDITGLSHSDPALASALGDALRGTAQIDWRRTAPVRLSDLSMTGAGLAVTGSGAVQTNRSGLPYQVAARLRTDDLARFAPVANLPLGGAAEVDLTGSGTLLGGAFDATLTGRTQDLQMGHPQIDLLLTGPGRIDMRAVRGMFGLVIPKLDISTDTARIQATGSVNGTAGGAVLSANLPDLSRVDRHLSGPADLGATLTWHDATAVTLHRFDFTGGGADVSGTGTLDLSDPDQPLAADLSVGIRDLAAWRGLAGRPLAGTLEVNADGFVQIAGAGDIALTVQGRGSNLSIGQAQADAILAGESRIEALIQRNSGVFRISTLDFITPQFRATATQDAAELITYDLRLANLSMLVPELPGALSANGTARQVASDWQIDTTLSGPGGTTGRVSGRIAGNGQNMDLTATGTAPLALANPFITPRSLDGNMVYDLRLNGAPSVQAVSGAVSFSDGRLTLPNLPLGLTGMRGQIGLAQGVGQIEARADVTSGGNILMRGTLGLSPGYDAALRATLDDVVLRDPELFETSVDGDIDLTGPLLGNGRIKGRLTLDTTEISIPSGGFGGSGYVPEITHLNTPNAVEQTRKYAGLVVSDTDQSGGSDSRLQVDLRIDAPNRIFVRGRGLDAELGGQLRVSGTVTNVVPSGQFDLIRGRLDILGKRLTLSEGAVGLQGGFDPTVRLVATTPSDDLLLQVVVEGRASDPEIQFLSEPELPQDEVLARLLFGRGIDTLSPLQAARLASAVATLSGRGGDGLAGQLRQQLDLDDLDVETDESGAAQLRAGKYISDNAYTDVTVNSRGESEINLNLDVSRNVTVKGRLGANGDTGIGVYFERDY